MDNQGRGEVVVYPVSTSYLKKDMEIFHMEYLFILGKI